ncbi:MAG: sigma-70 family RNA polymerase sigma factor [Bacteroidota bacterium]
MNLGRLIKGCIQLDRKAQKELYLHYCKLAINISLRYARDDHDAKDIVQNAFIKIFTKIEQFNPDKGTFDNWLKRIVINEALQLYRDNQRRQIINEDLTNIRHSEPPIILDQLMAEDLVKLLRQLPESYRIVFVLHTFEGYDHHTIGEKLNIAEGTSRSQLSRAKQLLRQLIYKQNQKDHAKRIAG